MPPTSRIMGETFANFRDDPELRVAILTGAGEKFFCPGWDLKAAAEGEAPDADYGVGGFGGLQELPGLNKPVIAAVNGLAFGGGFEIMISADIIIAAEHATFALPEINSGTLADAATIKLPRRIPYHVAMEMLFTGRRIDAAEAKHWGIVNEIVPAAESDDPRARSGRACWPKVRRWSSPPSRKRCARRCICRSSRPSTWSPSASSRRSTRSIQAKTSWKARAPSPRSASRSGRAASANKMNRRTFFKWLGGIALSGAAMTSYAFGIEPALFLRVQRYAPALPNWPSDFKLRVAVLADIHVGEPYMSLRHVEHIVETANALEPDLILMLGDYAAGHHWVTHKVTIKDTAAVLTGLRAPLGVHAILGNHDWWDDRQAQKRRASPCLYRTALESVGFPVYENDGVRLVHKDKPFWLLGLADQIAFIKGQARSPRSPMMRRSYS